MITNNLPESFLNLPEQYQRCIAEYLHSLNWIEAYYRVYGGNRKTAGSNAHIVYNRPEVQEALKELIEQRTMQDSEVLMRLEELARGTIGNYFLVDKELNFKKLLEDGKGYLVKKVRPTKYGDEIEFYDYQKAVETLAKIKGLFDERTQVSVNVSHESIEQKLEALRNKLINDNTE